MKKIIVCYIIFTCICARDVQGQDRPINQWLKEMKTAKDTSLFRLQYQAGNYFQDHEQFDSALIYLKAAKSTVEKTGYHRGLAMVNNSIGVIYRNYSNQEDAMKMFVQSLAISEKNNFIDLQSFSLFNMALLFGDQGDFQSALLFNRKVVDLNAALRDTLRMIKSYTYFGDIYGSLKKPDSATYYLKIGLDLCNQVKNLPMPQLMQARMNLLFNLAGVYITMGKPQDAMAILEPLYEQVKVMKLEVAQRYLLSNLAIGNNDMKLYDKALAYTSELETLLRKDSIPELYRNLYEIRSLIYANMGNYKDAFKNLGLQSEIKDQIYNITKQKTISDMRSRYESEKKDEAIAKLEAEKKSQRIIMGLTGLAAMIALGFLFFAYRSKKLQQKLFEQKEKSTAQEKKLEQAMMEKKMVELEQMALQSQMNPHFIFNCLNSIQEYVIDKDVVNANKYLSSFAHLIRQTLEASSKQKISLEDEIYYLKNYLELEKMRYKNQFTYSILVDHELSTSEIFIPAMLIQPFIENAIRHGILNKQDEGQLQIRFLAEGLNGILCTVTDDGIGRESALKIKKSAHPGFPSRGMQLVRERIELLNKQDQTAISLKYEDLVDDTGEPKGTRVKLIFQMKEAFL